MNLSLADQYYLKALDYYPFNLEFAVENLQYALSYDDEHAQALCLLGQIYMFQIKDFGEAKRALKKALVSDLNYPDTFKYLILLHVWLGEFEDAEQLMCQSLKISGMDRCLVLRLRALSYEMRANWKKAKVILNQAKLVATNAACIQAIDADLNRIKEKKNLKKKGKKSCKK